MANTLKNETVGMSPDETATYWFLRQEDGVLPASDRDLFDVWINASPVHAEAYRRAEAVWASFDEGLEDVNLTALRRSALATQRDRSKFTVPIWATAASVAGAAVVLFASGVFDGRIRTPNPNVEVSEAPTIQTVGPVGRHSTPKGPARMVALPDGTRVTMNTDTLIAVNYDGALRRVELLRGQALFEVAADRSRAFVVDAGDRQVQALGTVFDVRLDAASTSVVLIEGKVVVAGNAKASAAMRMSPTVLSPGQEWSVHRGAGARLASVDVKEELLWRDGYVQFDDVTLDRAIVEMNRYSNIEIRLAEPAVGRLRVSGVFKTGDPQRFAALVSETLPVSVERDEDGSVRLHQRDG